MQAFGIDIGGTGIKGAPVDVATGKLLAERKKFDTPQPSTPEAVAREQVLPPGGRLVEVGVQHRPARERTGDLATRLHARQWRSE